MKISKEEAEKRNATRKRLGEIVDESEDSQECCKKLIDEGLAISMSQGRRYWFTLKDKK